MTTFPLTLIWPADTQVAMPGDNWRRLDGEYIEATYRTPDELRLCMATADANGWTGAGDVEHWRKRLVSRWHRKLRVPGDSEQPELLAA